MKEATGVVNSGKKVVIAVTGGISAYKVPEVIRIVKRAGIQVRVVATEPAL
ncbi:MAG: flavoprotein, partial [Candidatus Nanopelagicales bacterium]